MKESSDKPVTAPKWSGVFCFWFSVGGFFVMAASIMLMPGMSIFPGVLFWGGLATGGAMQISLEKQRKQFLCCHRNKRKKYQKDHCGFVSFFTSKEAAITDVLMLLSGVSFAVCCQLTKGFGYSCYMMAAMTVFLFCMHCILNGRNYKHLKRQIQEIATKGERLS